MKREDRRQKTEDRSQKTEDEIQNPRHARLLSLVSPAPKAFGVNLLNSCRSAFTLIEILVVIVIITILAGLVVGAAKYAQTKQARSRAQAEIATMEMALERYKNDNGAYPLTPAGRPTTTTAKVSPYGYSGRLYAALTNGAGKYMTFKPNQIAADAGTTYIVDPFGTPYNYYCTSPVQQNQTNSATFDLWSYGPDNKNDTADDIVNWRQN
jgi:general secretion pathway protein G